MGVDYLNLCLSNMFEPAIMGAIFCTFLIAGTVKGVVGLGLPTVSLGLLTAIFDLPTAMVLLLVPSFVTNLWQAVIGGSFGIILRRIWLFLLLATVSVWIGALALRAIDLTYLSILLGILLLIYSILGLAGVKYKIDPRREVWAGPLLGSINGIFTGMTGSFAVPGVMYLQAIGLPRDQLVQAMGMLFFVSTLALASALKSNEFISRELGILSMSALVPALVGMVIGQKIRSKLSEQLFRRVFFIALLLLGGYIIMTSIV